MNIPHIEQSDLTDPLVFIAGGNAVGRPCLCCRRLVEPSVWNDRRCTVAPVTRWRADMKRSPMRACWTACQRRFALCRACRWAGSWQWRFCADAPEPGDARGADGYQFPSRDARRSAADYEPLIWSSLKRWQAWTGRRLEDDPAREYLAPIRRCATPSIIAEVVDMAAEYRVPRRFVRQVPGDPAAARLSGGAAALQNTPALVLCGAHDRAVRR